MVFGIILIISGILIALYPPLLSLIVAILLISTGSVFAVMGYRYKKVSRSYNDPFIDFFMKF